LRLAWCRETGLDTGAAGSTTVGATRLSCSRASYPGDGVTVGGAACTIDAPVASAAAATRAAQIRFM
jgi:hypothetical protein